MAATIKILKVLYRMTMPGAAILLLAFVLVRLGTMPAAESSSLRILPYLVFGVGLLLSAVFNRSRLFFALLLLLLTESWIDFALPRFSAVSAHKVAFSAVAILLPLNLLAFSFMRDRGVVSQAGRRRLLAVAVQVCAVAALSIYGSRSVATLLDLVLVPRQFTNWSGLPQLGLLAFAIAIGVLAVQVARRYNVVENGMLWTLAAALVSLRLSQSSYLAPLYFAAAGLVLIVAILETSYHMAFLDELTQLPSRRSFNQDLLKLGDSYTIAMVDVDHFKKFNDTFGHESGDEALRMVASKLARIAGGGKAYRYGGEEFAVLFPGKQPEESFSYLDRMRRHIEQSTFTVRGLDRRKGGKRGVARGGKKETHVTVSIGVSSCNGERATPDEILRIADQALYKAKAKGRNCTVAAKASKPAGSVKAANYGMRVVSVE